MTTEANEPPGGAEAVGELVDRDERLRELLSIRIAPDEDAPVNGRPGPSHEALQEPLGLRFDDRRAATSPSWRTVIAGSLLLSLFMAGLGLVYAGTKIVRGSTEGEVLAPISDPEEPGYEAIVDSTPTMAVLHDRAGVVDAITVLTLPSPEGGGGGVVFVPTRTVSEVPVFGRAPISAAYDLGTPSGMSNTVGDLLGAAMDEFTVVDADRWADLVAPVAPLSIDNPDSIRVAGEVVFPVGVIDLEADEVGAYLESTVEGESDLARLFRHELVWRAWIEAVGARGDDAAVPGEVESGLGRFVRTLSRDVVLYETLPVRPTDAERYGDRGAFIPDVPAIESLVARTVPFPRSPSPGARSRVQILNGTDETDRARSVARLLPPAGVEVVLIGNAAEFGVERTRVSFTGGQHRDEAEAIREVLGVGQVVEEQRPSDVVDITVTLGADYE